MSGGVHLQNGWSECVCTRPTPPSVRARLTMRSISSRTKKSEIELGARKPSLRAGHPRFAQRHQLIERQFTRFACPLARELHGTSTAGLVKAFSSTEER